MPRKVRTPSVEMPDTRPAVDLHRVVGRLRSGSSAKRGERQTALHAKATVQHHHRAAAAVAAGTDAALLCASKKSNRPGKFGATTLLWLPPGTSMY